MEYAILPPPYFNLIYCILVKNKNYLLFDFFLEKFKKIQILFLVGILVKKSRIFSCMIPPQSPWL